MPTLPRTPTRTREVSGSPARAGRDAVGFLPVVVDTRRTPDSSQPGAGEGPSCFSPASVFLDALGVTLCLAILIAASTGWLELAMAWLLGVV